MADVQNFPRYSKKENWLTNNTLLLLQYFYNHDSKRFEDFLEGILGEQSNVSFLIGPKFKQQVRSRNSVPDAHIFQKSFSIVIEAKPHGDLRMDQLLKHAETFNYEKEKVLLAITKGPVKSTYSKKIKREIKNKADSKNIYFGTITYEEIITGIRQLLMEHELSMHEILDDYEKMCQEENMISTKKSTMLVVSTGDSFNENMKYNIYYNPIERNHRKHFKYLGIYTDKAIRGVGEVKAAVACNLTEAGLTPREGEEEIFKKLTDEQKKSVKEIIINTDYNSLESGIRFFLVDSFHKMEYIKSSPGGVRKKKYFNLKNVDGFEEGISSEELANLLDGKEWG